MIILLAWGGKVFPDGYELTSAALTSFLYDNKSDNLYMLLSPITPSINSVLQSSMMSSAALSSEFLLSSAWLVRSSFVGGGLAMPIASVSVIGKNKVFIASKSSS